MSQFSGRQHKGAARGLRDSKRVEAKQRQEKFDDFVAEVATQHDISAPVARSRANVVVSGIRNHKYSGVRL